MLIGTPGNSVRQVMSRYIQDLEALADEACQERIDLGLDLPASYKVMPHPWPEEEYSGRYVSEHGLIIVSLLHHTRDGLCGQDQLDRRQALIRRNSQTQKYYGKSLPEYLNAPSPDPRSDRYTEELPVPAREALHEELMQEQDDLKRGVVEYFDLLGAPLDSGTINIVRHELDHAAVPPRTTAIARREEELLTAYRTGSTPEPDELRAHREEFETYMMDSITGEARAYVFSLTPVHEIRKADFVLLEEMLTDEILSNYPFIWTPHIIKKHIIDLHANQDIDPGSHGAIFQNYAGILRRPNQERASGAYADILYKISERYDQSVEKYKRWVRDSAKAVCTAFREEPQRLNTAARTRTIDDFIQACGA